jgi:nucleoid-associated protein YgaU
MARAQGYMGDSGDPYLFNSGCYGGIDESTGSPCGDRFDGADAGAEPEPPGLGAGMKARRDAKGNIVRDGRGRFFVDYSGDALKKYNDGLARTAADRAQYQHGWIAAAGSAIGSVASGAANIVTKIPVVGNAIAGAENLVQQGLKAVTNNPLWDIARTGVSFIPGVGTAVSAGMAGAAAVGRGESLANIGLAAAKGAIPGGPIVLAAFDVGAGLLSGKNVTDAVLAGVRSQVPGGAIGQAAFDAAVALKNGTALSAAALDAVRSQVAGGAEGKAVFDAAISAGLGTGQIKPPDLSAVVPGAFGSAVRAIASGAPASSVAALGKFVPRPDQAFKIVRAAQQIAAAAPPVSAALAARRSSVPFPNLSGTAARVAATLQAQPMLRSMPAARVASLMKVPTIEVKHAISAWTNRAQNRPLTHATNVGDADSLDAFMADEGAGPFYEDAGELDGSGGWIVRSGETMQKIAKAIVGDQNRWRELATANPQVKNPDAIFVGQRLTVPAAWILTPAAPPAAVNPAAILTTIGAVVPTNAPIPSPAIQTGTSQTAQTARPTIRQGSTGTAVREWQGLMKITTDGIFGPNTKAATVAYQKSRGLTADGIVGPITWNAALSNAPAVVPLSSPLPSGGGLGQPAAQAPSSPDIVGPGGKQQKAAAPAAQKASMASDGGGAVLLALALGAALISGGKGGGARRRAA